MRRTAPITVVVMLLVMPVEITAQDLSGLSDADRARGERMYRARCARCHGLDGGGGEGPALARPFLSYARDDETLVSVIQNGIPGTGMPPGGWLSDLESRQIAAFVRTMGRTTAPVAPRGDPGRGETIFHNRGACVSCHGVNGVGTEFGPELSTIGSRRNPDHIPQSILDPGADLPRGLSGVMASTYRDYLPVGVRTSAAEAVVGHRVNETSFTILVRDEAGVLYAFDKTRLIELRKQFGQSLMPGYRDELSATEVDDLVAYLVGLGDIIP